MGFVFDELIPAAALLNNPGVTKEEFVELLSEIKDELLKHISQEELVFIVTVFRNNIIFAYFDEKQFNKARDISMKRNIPRLDALHDLLARDTKAIMITRDKHFDKLLDISPYKKPEDIDEQERKYYEEFLTKIKKDFEGYESLPRIFESMKSLHEKPFTEQTADTLMQYIRELKQAVDSS